MTSINGLVVMKVLDTCFLCWNSDWKERPKKYRLFLSKPHQIMVFYLKQRVYCIHFYMYILIYTYIYI